MSRVLIAAVLFMSIGFATTAQAVPVPTPGELDGTVHSAVASFAPAPPRDHRPGRANRLDDPADFAQYRLLCDFLAAWQVLEAGDNHGALLECEGDAPLYETDNTQEAVRIWSQYALWTGDTARYGERIRAALGYCRRHSAWNEEWDGLLVYRAHNCGWGFQATAVYRQAYGDTSWNWYADSCAIWTTQHPLVIDTVGAANLSITPNAQGLAIGGLYPHALYRGRTDWADFAVARGRTIRRFFEVNPARLHTNNSWALSAGTAVWGMGSSLFAAYPDSGAAWVNTYGPQLGVWVTDPNVGHPESAWYSNAQHICFDLTGDSLYWHNAAFITDSLIALDRDHDGGIPRGPGTSDDNDCTWPSSYMGWMGMTRFIDRQTPRDAAALGFISPAPTLPHLAGDSLQVVGRVANSGFTPLSVLVSVSGPDYREDTLLTMEAGTFREITFPRPWVLADDETLPDTPALHMSVQAPADGNVRNDTVTTLFDIRRSVSVAGTIRSAMPSGPFPVRIEFYHQSYPDSLWLAIDQSTDSSFVTGPHRLMAGQNEIRVVPPLRCMEARQIFDWSVQPNPHVVSLMLPPTDVAVMNDSRSTTLAGYYSSALAPLGLNARLARTGSPFDLSGVPRVIWFTGSVQGHALDSAEQAALSTYLQHGGRLLLTGQNIVDDSAGTGPFLRSTLHCAPGLANVGDNRALGDQVDSIFGTADVWISGSGGANNQTSPSSVIPLTGATPILRYALTGEDVAGVKGRSGQGRFVFLGFGAEAVTGAEFSTSRQQLFERCFAWLGTPLSVGPRAELPAEVTLHPNFPNPFNPTTAIEFSAPRASRVSIDIFNLLGQNVCTVFDGAGTGHVETVLWDGRNRLGVPVSGGTYICRLRTGTTTLSRTMQLIR
jgi:hypothetical protein